MDLKVEQLALEMADISGSTFQKVKAEALIFNNVNLSKSQINNANMSGMVLNDVNMTGFAISDANLSELKIKNANFIHAVIDHVYLFGTEFRNVILPNEGDRNYDPNGEYKPISFQNCDLSGGQLTKCKLTNMEISDCDISGLKINGVLIEDLINKMKSNA